MLIKDEVDVIEYTIKHLLTQVDQIIVSDNMSTDGTLELVDQIRRDNGDRILTQQDEEVGYYQDRKTSFLAMQAWQLGHSWVLPCDADEYWASPDGRPISDYLDGLAPDLQIIRAPLYIHLATSLDDPEEPNPFRRMGWRKREPQPLQFGKVLCRARADLHIHMGNHSASTEGSALEGVGLEIRHYQHRSPEQFIKKVRNGGRAYEASVGLEAHGQHWRGYYRILMERGEQVLIDEVFNPWWLIEDPEADGSLVYNPVA